MQVDGNQKGGAFSHSLFQLVSALDAFAEAEFFYHFRRLLDGRSAIIISHRFSTVAMADRVCVVESGSHPQLMEQRGQYARLFNAQAGLHKMSKVV